jgi:protein gp37
VAESKIEWADFTFNPWWGCTRVSPGCERCYAEAWAKRTGQAVWGPTAPRRFFGDEHWRGPLRWNAAATAVRRRVFCASMADVFEMVRPTHPTDLALRMNDARQRLWALIAATPALDWLLLTKRPENVDVLVPMAWLEAWPANVWLGATVEDRRRAGERLVPLTRLKRVLDIPVVFVSYEPALELVDFRPWLANLDWIIVGGESGGGARPFAIEWASVTIAHARAAGVAPFVKQLGTRPAADVGGELVELVVRGKRTKNEDPNRWPEDLRVREFPRREAVA